MESKFSQLNPFANKNLHRIADGSMGGPRDRKLAQSIVDLQALLDILGGKSQSLPNETLDRCQQSVDMLTVEIQGTLAVEGVAYTRPDDECPLPVHIYRR
jgi:hypothetical protein